MKYLKSFESIQRTPDHSVDIQDICDIFTDLMDDGANIHLYQYTISDYFFVYLPPPDKHDVLTYTGSLSPVRLQHPSGLQVVGRGFDRLTSNKEYWFEISVDSSLISNGSYLKTNNIINTYNSYSITHRLEDLGFTDCKIERRVTRWNIFGLNPSPVTNSIKISCRLF